MVRLPSPGDTHLLWEDASGVDFGEVLLGVSPDLQDAASRHQRCYRLPGPVVQVKAAEERQVLLVGPPPSVLSDPIVVVEKRGGGAGGGVVVNINISKRRLIESCLLLPSHRGGAGGAMESGIRSTTTVPPRTLRNTIEDFLPPPLLCIYSLASTAELVQANIDRASMHSPFPHVPTNSLERVRRLFLRCLARDMGLRIQHTKNGWRMRSLLVCDETST